MPSIIGLRCRFPTFSGSDGAKKCCRPSRFKHAGHLKDDTPSYLLAGVEKAGSGLGLGGKVSQQESLQPQGTSLSLFATISSRNP